MGLTRLASQAKAHLYGILRVGLGASVLGAGIVIGTTAVGSPPAGAGPVFQGCGISTAVEVGIHNQTSQRIFFTDASLGTGNVFCQAVPSQVDPHSQAFTGAGNDLFGTEIHLVYFANGAGFVLDASSGNPSFPSFTTEQVACAVQPPQHRPEFATRCHIHIEGQKRGAPFDLATRVAIVQWEIQGP